MNTESSDHENSCPKEVETPPVEERRSFFSRLTSWWMGLSLVASYGTFGSFIVRFLYPSGKTDKTWQFVTDLDSFLQGESLTFVSPAGEKAVIMRLEVAGTADDFIALSSVCPHLGCQVHWEAQKNRFFCPCHHGVFDPQGNPLAGPPKGANQSLPRYPLKVEGGLLFIEAKTEKLVLNDSNAMKGSQVS